ncbi:MAG: STAS domain-containing protein [Vulcanimicrobiaceae bacterium]
MPTTFDYHAADVAKLEDSILRAHARGQKRVVLDLDHVEDLGTAELRGLITLLRRSRQAGGELVLRTAKGEVIRALRLTALDRLFPVEDLAAEAAA